MKANRRNYLFRLLMIVSAIVMMCPDAHAAYEYINLRPSSLASPYESAGWKRLLNSNEADVVYDGSKLDDASYFPGKVNFHIKITYIDDSGSFKYVVPTTDAPRCQKYNNVESLEITTSDLIGYDLSSIYIMDAYLDNNKLPDWNATFDYGEGDINARDGNYYTLDASYGKYFHCSGPIKICIKPGETLDPKNIEFGTLQIVVKPITKIGFKWPELNTSDVSLDKGDKTSAVMWQYSPIVFDSTVKGSPWNSKVTDNDLKVDVEPLFTSETMPESFSEEWKEALRLKDSYYEEKRVKGEIKDSKLNLQVPVSGKYKVTISSRLESGFYAPPVSGEITVAPNVEDMLINWRHVPNKRNENDGLVGFGGEVSLPCKGENGRTAENAEVYFSNNDNFEGFYKVTGEPMSWSHNYADPAPAFASTLEPDAPAYIDTNGKIPEGYTQYDPDKGVDLTQGNKVTFVLRKNGVTNSRTVTYTHDDTEISTGVAGLTAPAAEEEVYTLTGVKVHPENLSPGLYLKRKKGETVFRTVICRFQNEVQ